MTSAGLGRIAELAQDVGLQSQLEFTPTGNADLGVVSFG